MVRKGNWITGYGMIIAFFLVFGLGPVHGICQQQPLTFTQQQQIDLQNNEGIPSQLLSHFKDAEYLLVGFSSPTCTHCVQKAAWMNTDSAFQNKVSGEGSCEFVSLIHDQTDPESALFRRLALPEVNNQSFVGFRSRKVVDAENSRYTTPTVYGGPEITGTPTFMILNRKGQMVAMRQGELPQLFDTLCIPNSCNGNGTPPSTGTIDQPGGGSCPGGGGGGTNAGGTNAGGTNAGGTNAGGTNAGGTNAGGTNAGGTNAGGTNAGGTNAGGTNAGGTNAGGTNAGGTNAGGTSAGGTSAGGTSAGGTSAGGTSAGGTNAGGTNAGGTNAGGTNAGGTSAGGTSAGGTSAGGTSAGGTSAGGTSAGGTSAGGTNAGGTNAGGTNAGGVIGSMRPGRLQLEIPITNTLQGDIVAKQKELNSQNSKQSLTGMFRLFNEWMWMLLMLVFFVAVIYAGYTLITSVGDSDKMKKGLRMLMYVVFGLAIALLSWAVISLIAGMFA